MLTFHLSFSTPYLILYLFTVGLVNVSVGVENVMRLASIKYPASYFALSTNIFYFQVLLASLVTENVATDFKNLKNIENFPLNPG